MSSNVAMWEINPPWRFLAGKIIELNGGFSSWLHSMTPVPAISLGDKMHRFSLLTSHCPVVVISICLNIPFLSSIPVLSIYPKFQLDHPAFSFKIHF